MPCCLGLQVSVWSDSCLPFVLYFLALPDQPCSHNGLLSVNETWHKLDFTPRKVMWLLTPPTATPCYSLLLCPSKYYLWEDSMTNGMTLTRHYPKGSETLKLPDNTHRLPEWEGTVHQPRGLAGTGTTLSWTCLLAAGPLTCWQATAGAHGATRLRAGFGDRWNTDRATEYCPTFLRPRVLKTKEKKNFQPQRSWLSAEMSIFHYNFKK